MLKLNNLDLFVDCYINTAQSQYNERNEEAVSV